MDSDPANPADEPDEANRTDSAYTTGQTNPDEPAVRGPDTSPMLQFDNVSKNYGTTLAVDGFDLTVARGEFICLIGPSGCGKTTTLKMVNRLVEPSGGAIYVEGKDIMSQDVVQLRRGIGYVIQQIGLFPHMTISENISLVTQLNGWPAEKRERRAAELLELVELDPEEYGDRYPRELSGGQQQRVGVLRALAAEPELILMDEPFGALDPITRESLQDELKRLHDKLQKTIVFVTHDMDEALKLADRIVLMKDGHIVQVGTPDELLREPANEFVESFLGSERRASATEYIAVDDLMKRRVVTARPTMGLAEGVRRMRRERVDSLIIVDDDKLLVGTVTARAIQQSRETARTMEELVDATYPFAEIGASADEVLQRMFVEQLDFMPVVNETGEVQGIITRASLVDLLSKSDWPQTGTPEEVSW